MLPTKDRLLSEALVDLLRNRGAAIRLLSLKETMDVLDVAERMTGLLARTAARGVVEPAHRRMLPAALKELTQAVNEEDADGFARGRRHFYRALLLLSGSAELKRLFPAIQMPRSGWRASKRTVRCNPQSPPSTEFGTRRCRVNAPRNSRCRAR
jgi:DNA-binding GntR family transcriptional regulator